MTLRHSGFLTVPSSGCASAPAVLFQLAGDADWPLAPAAAADVVAGLAGADVDVAVHVSAP
ncbi:MAG: hypothetical protein ACRD0K_25255 [Egibacteraceae bacterium]